MRSMKARIRRGGVLFLVVLALALLGLAVLGVLQPGTGQAVFPTLSHSPTPGQEAAYPPMPVVTPSPHAYPDSTPDATAVVLFAAKETAIVAATLKGVPSPIVGATFSPAEQTAVVQQFKDRAEITLEDNGQTVTVTLGLRFFVFLDDESYPVRSLTCEPDWKMGYISNGSFRGPDLYPVYYEATELGSCVLKSRDFVVTVTVVEPAPGAPVPP